VNLYKHRWLSFRFMIIKATSKFNYDHNIRFSLKKYILETRLTSTVVGESFCPLQPTLRKAESQSTCHVVRILLKFAYNLKKRKTFSYRFSVLLHSWMGNEFGPLLTLWRQRMWMHANDSTLIHVWREIERAEETRELTTHFKTE